MKLISIIERFFLSPEKWARKQGVKVGQGCYIGIKNWPSEAYLIEIGDNCRIAPETSFYTHGGIWTLRKLYNDCNLDHFGKIKVGSNSYIGERCMIMAGVSIGERCIIGGGSVVTKSVPDGCMVAGNPARFIGFTEDFYQRLKAKHDTQTGQLSAEDKKLFLQTMNENLYEKKPFVKIEDR